VTVIVYRNSNDKKGDFVRKYSVVAITLLCFCGMAVAAHAQEEGTMVVTVPFEFVAGHKTLPAGIYTVGRAAPDTNSPLIISDRNHSSFLLPAAFDDTPADDVRLSFEHVGNTYLLSQVKTQIGTYTFVGDPTAGLAKLARMRPHDSTKNSMTTASGSQ
jgi:hypothetical protein